MTIENTQVVASYAGDGIEDTFSVTQNVQENSGDENAQYIDVVIRDGNGDETTLPQTDWTYTTTEPTPGLKLLDTITLDTPPADDETVFLVRNTPLTQESSYPTSGPFPAKSHEYTLDKIVRMIQDLAYGLRRTIRASVTSGLLDLELPTPSAGAAIGWNAGENGLVNIDVSGSSGGDTEFEEQESLLANNQAVAASITGLQLDKTLVRTAIIFAQVYRKTGTQELVSIGQIRAIYRAATNAWELAPEFAGDDNGTDVVFSIDSTGQVKYTSANLTGGSYSGKINFRIMTMGV